MSAIARILIEQGRRVSGSDVSDSETVRSLRALGAQVAIGHQPEHVNGAQLVITSTAIASDNPELAEATRRGIRVVHRSEMWAHLLNARQGIAVAGAHGKTTITSMISWVMYHAGLDPTFLIGGEVAGLGGARSGNGPHVVAEADESDRSFLRYRPWCTVLTSIEADHLEHYQNDFAELVQAYRQFLGNVRPDGFMVVCSDDATVLQVASGLRTEVIRYGLSDGADLTATDIALEGFGSTFGIVEQGRPLVQAKLCIPGRHNVQNALAAFAVARQAGVPVPQIVELLARFKGARRRFDVLSNAGGILVVDDYAHHPSEIHATLASARSGWPNARIIAIFQPHRYARTQYLENEFATAFECADHVVITEVYAPPPEVPIPGVSGQHLAGRIQHAAPGVSVEFVESAQVPDHLAKMIRPSDIAIFMGAGDISQTARHFANGLREP